MESIVRSRCIVIMRIVLLLMAISLLAGCDQLRDIANIPFFMSQGRATPQPTAAPIVAEALSTIPTTDLSISPDQMRLEADEKLREVQTLAGETIAIPPHMIERIRFDGNDFIDGVRIETATLLMHDVELAHVLIDRVGMDGLDPDLRARLLDILKLLVQADYFIVTISADDSEFIVESARKAGEEVSDVGLQAAEVENDRARKALTSLMDAFWQGDARKALNLIVPTWESTAAVRTVWGLKLLEDYDEDGIIDLQELGLGSSPFVLDSDGDGLTDAYEINFTIPETMPGDPDTDGDGVYDGDEDLDIDGVTNAMERDLGTDPRKLDSDGDGLGDIILIIGEEAAIEAGDSDGDGLNDESELRLGSDPNHVDSDQDGTPDSQEYHLQLFSDEALGLWVELQGLGDHTDLFRIEPMVGAPGYAGNFGQVGNFIRLSSGLPILSAKVRLAYDETIVPAGDEANLRLFLYDESEGLMVMLDDPSVDSDGNTIQGVARRLGPIGIIYLPIWEAVSPQ